MSSCQQQDDQPLEQVILPNDDLLYFIKNSPIGFRFRS
jgi:hypothetical protein